jgi:histidinol-phosphate aminotransferase
MAAEAHGALNPSELHLLGLKADQILDFSANCTPFGPSKKVALSLQKINLAAYPDPQCSALVNRLAVLNGCDHNTLLVGNGAAQLIWLIVAALADPARPVLQLSPTFGEYLSASRAQGIRAEEFRLLAPHFELDVQAFCHHIEQCKPSLVFVCQPNNPTGRLLSEAQLQSIIEACAVNNCYLVIDEAYLWFANKEPFYAGMPKHVLCLRSLTKDLGIASLRLGYVLADADLIDRIAAKQPPWSVNGVAQACGLAALDDLQWTRSCIKKTQQLSIDLFDELRGLGYKLLKSDTHFTLIRVSDAGKLRQKLLLEKHIQVRDCSSFALPDYIRIATRQKGENEKLVDALKEMRSFIV